MVATQDGALWTIDPQRHVTAIRAPGARITQLRALPDHISIYIGDAAGNSVIWDTRASRWTPLLRAGDAIRDVAISADGTTIAVAANDNVLHLGVRHDNTWTSLTWTELAAPVRKATLTRDGLLVSICTDGTVWIYSLARRVWLCLATSTTELSQLTLDDTETTAFLFDVDGHLIAIDLEAVRKALAV